MLFHMMIKCRALEEKMLFCKNCGNKILADEKFCKNCGSMVSEQTLGAGATRQAIYEGAIYKCPNCGEVLESFVSNCPSCGCEIRNASATNSVVTFYNELMNAQTTEQKEYIIRNYPIPNSKEDIMEFMLLTSTNILGEGNKDIFKAWMAKFELCYQKALLIFRNDNDIHRVQQIYDDCQNRVKNDKDKKTRRNVFETIGRNIIVGIGLILLLIAVNVDRSGGNSSMYQLISMIVLVVSAISLVQRKTAMMDYLVAACSGLIAIVVSHLFRNGSMLQLCGGIVLIIVAVNYIKCLVSKK